MSDALEIPDAAIDAGMWEAGRYGLSDTDSVTAAEDVLRAGAPLIVAAELESMADYQDRAATVTQTKGERDWVMTVAQSLRARAAELRGTPNGQ